MDHRFPLRALPLALTALIGGFAHQSVGSEQISPQDWAIAQSALCDPAIREAEHRHHLPPGILETIARAESARPITGSTDLRPWPWTINADGNALFLDSKDAAVAWVDQQSLRHHYIDVGCLQVDLMVHAHAFSSLKDAFDPKMNADFAASHLAELYRGEAKRDWNVAVGLYHSHTPMLAVAYRDRVSEIGARVLNGVLDPVPLYVRAIRQGTLRVPLGNGLSTPINVQRQPTPHAHRKPNSCQIARVLGPFLNGPSHPACRQVTGTESR